VRGLLARGFQRVELRAEVGQLGAEVADALDGLFLLGRVEFLFREGVVLVDGAGEGGEGGGEGAQGRGGYLLLEWLGRGGEGGEVFADRGALFERAVEGCVLEGKGVRIESRKKRERGGREVPFWGVRCGSCGG
jgi:hypothetical protein